MVINFILGENAKMPTQEHLNDAGYDLYAAVETIIPANGRAKVDTNLQWEPQWDMEEYSIVTKLSLGVYMDIRDRSGNSLKKGLLKMAGVVDETYRGNIGVVLLNTTNEDIKISISDKIAQAVFSPCYHPRSFVNVKEMKVTKRSDNGFGSSGVAGNVVQ